MSNTNNTIQTQTSNTLHTAIMEACGKDRPPMLAPGNYVQWKSRIKRYTDTKPNHELIHYCLKNPPYMYKWADNDVPVTEGSSETTIERYMENYKNISQDIRDQLNAEAEAVQIILTGIDNDIYSTVDACPNACEMWKAIERLKKGESINVQDLETNLYGEFGKFTSWDDDSLESYYSRFYKMMNDLVRNQCDVTNHQVNVQFLLQLQPEWQSIGTPMATKPKLDTNLSGTPVDQTRYQSMIGSLMYLISSRPDLVQAVCYCARYQARPMEKHLTLVLQATKHLDADLSGTPVDETKYQSIVGALMYLTASRPDIVHATCYCARYQAKPTEKHFTAVKRIFRYLKYTIHIGLWYPKDTGFELTAFSDSDHTGCLDSCKSTSGGIQFLGGDKLVSWSSKKQDCTSMSSAEAETENQLADLFTKALSEDRFKYLVRRLGIRCLTPEELDVLTKIKLTLEQSQQGVSNDVLVSIEGAEELKRNVWIKGEKKATL
nr:hypothetical protein [Tanacetum cinerariifolium]